MRILKCFCLATMLTAMLLAACGTADQPLSPSVQGVQITPSLQPARSTQTESRTASPSPLPSQQTPTLETTPVISTTGPLAGGLKLVYSQLTATTIQVWAANPLHPDVRKLLFVVDRYGGAGINGRISPDGAKIAYTAYPPGSNGTNRLSADLWIADLNNPQPMKVAALVDYGVYHDYPVWSPDSTRIAVYRRSSRQLPTQASIVVVNSQTGQQVVVAQASLTTLADDAANDIHPLDWSADGTYLYYLKGYAGHVDLWKVPVSQGQAMVVREVTTQGTPLCTTFSPAKTAFVCLVWQYEPDANVILFLPIEQGDSRVLITGALKDVTVPIWRPYDSAVTLNPAPTTDQAEGVQVIDPQSGAKQAFLLVPKAAWPLSWSPDGRWLALYQTPEQRGPLMLAGNPDEQPIVIAPGRGLAVIGWTDQNL